MFLRAITLIAAGTWALSLSGQTAPTQRFPGVPQFVVQPEPTATPEIETALRKLLKTQQKPAVCSIPLLVVAPAKNLEPMPVLRPPANIIDRMPLMKVAAPPCEEEKR